MAGDILTGTTHYNAVRNMLGVDSTAVSDSLIESLDLLTYVEGQVKVMVTDWAALKAAAGQDYVRLQMGVAAWVAARLCGTLRRDEGRSFKIGPYAQTASKTDWAERAGELARDAKSYLAQISTQSAPARVTLFTRDGPTRSRTNVPGSDDFEYWLDKIEPGVIDWLEDGQT